MKLQRGSLSLFQNQYVSIYFSLLGSTPVFLERYLFDVRGIGVYTTTKKNLMSLHVKDSRRILRPSLVLVLQERNVTTPSSNVRNKDRIFQGLKPYKTDLTVLQQQNVVDDNVNKNNKNNKNKNNNNYKITNPLLILQKACTMRGIADEQGYRLTGAPWGFSLAEIREEIRNDHNNSNHNDPREVQQQQQQQQQSPPRMFPSVRTIGFQRISEKGLDWLIKRPRSSSSSITATTSMTTMSNSTTNLLKPVALCYTEGIYPPTNPNDSCEQWRAEGQPIEIPVTEILDTVPMKSFAQILAVGRLEEEEVVVAVKEGQLHHQERPLPPPPPQQQRPLSMTMKDREGFLALVAQVTQELYDNRIELKELEDKVQVLRLLPNRMELLVNGEQIWERFEWTRQKQQPKNNNHNNDTTTNNNGWMQTQHQLLPY